LLFTAVFENTMIIEIWGKTERYLDGSKYFYETLNRMRWNSSFLPGSQGLNRGRYGSDDLNNMYGTGLTIVDNGE